jgi:pectate lyase
VNYPHLYWLLTAIAFTASTGSGATLAFPGAEGFGANATGGRGGDVYYVTTLQDSGKGSLRDGLNTAKKGPRTILFKVSGTIHLADDLTVKWPNITIAGQSAPGDGICLADSAFTIDASDVIVRHLRVRLGTKYKRAEDAITITGGTNIIVDHCSASWSVDETFSVVQQAQNVTVQWCYITESLNQSVHTKGAHGFGSLIRPRRDASYTFHHNLYAHHSSRNPRPGTYNEKTLRLDFRNNVIYDWGFKAGYDNFTNEFVELNYVNNYLIAGPSTTVFTAAFESSGVNTHIFQSGNFFDVNTNGLANGADTGWAMFKGDLVKQEKPFAAPAVKTDSAPSALARVLDRAGALPWRRDPVDARVTGTVRKQTGRIINSTDDVGGWPELKSSPAPLDSDDDGMPDEWEISHGLNPKLADNNADRDKDGYTNLEEYLNQLADGASAPDAPR